MRFLFVIVNAVLCSATTILYATDCEDGAPNSLRTLLAGECDGGECEARVVLACTPTLVSLGQLEIAEGMNVTISAEGDIVVDGSSAPAADRGGWIYMTGGELTIDGLTIQNFTSSTRGGVIGMRGSGNMRLSITKSTFKNNEANWYGGALYLYGADGDVEGTATLEVADATFENNKAYYNGGAVHLNGLYGNLTASFSNILWTDNWATDGGGLANLFGQVQISDSTLRSNKATHYGGGVFQYTVSQTSPDAYSHMSNVTFITNSDSDASGDLYFFDDAGNSAFLCNCSFTEMHANESRILVESGSC